MWYEVEDKKNRTIHKIYLAILLCIVLVIIPIQQLRRIFKYYTKYDDFITIINGIPSSSTINQLEIIYLYPLLSRNPYKGTWKSSIKRSNFLKEEQGSIQIRTIHNKTEQINSYDLHIRIIDGQYRDNDYFDIIIYDNSLKVNQQYQKGKAIYQTTSPLIGFYQKGHLFKQSQSRPLYINKLKFKILANYASNNQSITSIKIQLLIFSQYEINIIGKQLSQYQQTAHDILLAILLMIQFIIQGISIYKISAPIIEKKQCAERFSKIGFLVSISLDIVEAIGLTILGIISTKKLAVFSMPILTIWGIIIGIEVRVLTILFQQEFKENSLKFSAKIYGILCATFAISYFSNFNNYFLVATTLMAIFPQIYNNYMVGHKLKQSMHHFLCYTLCRYTFIPYLRVYQYNIFSLQSDLTIFAISMSILFIQCTLLFLQIKYGSRSIVPKFWHSEQLKYFLSLPDEQDGICSICLVSLKEKGSMEHIEMSQFRESAGEEVFNSIVLTPCKHKFHIQCLFISMKTKLQCPYCRTVLPPLEE